MLSKKHVLFIFFILFNICFAENKFVGDEKDTIVAKIGQDYIVTFKDLRQYVDDWQYNLKYRNRMQLGVKVALDALLKNQMKRFDFFEKKLNENKNLMRSMNRVINEELTVSYFTKLFYSKYASEKVALEQYKSMDKEVTYYQIILPLHGDETKKVKDSLKTRALKIEKDFYKAKDVEKFVKKYITKDAKEDNPKKITWEVSLNDPVGNVAYNLDRGFTRVVESMDGYYIIKVTDIKKISLRPFEKMKNEIITKLKDIFFPIYEDEFAKKKKEYVDDSTIKWNAKSLSKITEWSNIQRFYLDGTYADTIKNILENGKNFEIMSYNKGSIDLKEYLRLLDEVLVLNPSGVINIDQVKSFILDAVRTDYIVKEARKVVDEKDIFNPYTKNPILKNRIAIEYNNEMIENKIPEATPEALHKFYDEHKDSIFYQLKVVYIHTRIYTDSLEAVYEMNEIKKGIPFEKISNSYLNKGFIREKDGQLKSHFSSEPPYLAQTAFKLELNQVVGPVEYTDTSKVKNYAVIKCAEIIPEKQLTYEDVKRNIKETFIDYYRNKISDEVDMQLKKKYKVEIFENVLSNALSIK